MEVSSELLSAAGPGAAGGSAVSTSILSACGTIWPALVSAVQGPELWS